MGVEIGVDAGAKVDVAWVLRSVQLISAVITAIKEKNISPVIDRDMGLHTLVLI